eukprot:17562-Eustigmatos_ZCMA.PRE.1
MRSPNFWIISTVAQFLMCTDAVAYQVRITDNTTGMAFLGCALSFAFRPSLASCLHSAGARSI